MSASANLIFRNLFFTALQPGIVAGLIPLLLVKHQILSICHSPIAGYQYAGILVFLIGLSILFTCIIQFITQGKGTISPADPTKQLIVSGLYKYSRNAMYIGVLLLLAGETVFFASPLLLLYTIVVFIAFHLFILFVEEPRLEHKFGEEYQEYCSKVKRWF